MSGWKEDEDGEGGETGTVFEDVDLTEKEWADYDERFHNIFSNQAIEVEAGYCYALCLPGRMNRLLSRKSESALSQ